MKVTLTESPDKQAGKRRKRRRRRGSITTRKPRENVGRLVAVALSRIVSLKRTKLPEALETVEGNPRSQGKKVMLLLMLGIALFGLRTCRL